MPFPHILQGDKPKMKPLHQKIIQEKRLHKLANKNPLQGDQ